MPAPLPDHKRAAILNAIKTGGTCRGIAREHNVSTDTVRRIAHKHGITDAFSRANTQKATAASAVDCKAARAVEAVESIAVAKELRSRILRADSGRDAQGWAIAYGIMIDKHGKLTDMDADLHGLAAVDAWLRDITAPGP